MSDKYRSSTQQRILLCLTRLAGHEVNGMTPGELARVARITPANATKDLANLAIAGLAEQMPDTGRWRLGPKIIQMALAHMQGIERAKGKLNETEQRYSRAPR